MTTFQLIGIPLFILLIFITLFATYRGFVNKRLGIGWSLLWLAAAVTIARPELTARIASVLGIGRGTDLVLYCAIIFMLVGFFLLYVKLRRLDEQVTILVRHIAVSEHGSQAKRSPGSGE